MGERGRGLYDLFDQGPERQNRFGEEIRPDLLPVALDAHKIRASELLIEAGYTAMGDGIDRLAKAIFVAHFRFAQAMERRAGGDWREDKTPGVFPPLPQGPVLHPAAPTEAGTTMDVILKGWAADYGHDITGRGNGRAAYDRITTFNRLATFRGHRDASRIVKADAVRWIEEMQGRVRHWSLTTLRDRLGKIGAKIVRHGRSIAFQMAEIMVPRTLFRQIRNANAVASVVTRPMLRDGDMTGRVDHREEKCVLMSAAVYRYIAGQKMRK